MSFSLQWGVKIIYKFQFQKKNNKGDSKIADVLKGQIVEIPFLPFLLEKGDITYNDVIWTWYVVLFSLCHVSALSCFIQGSPHLPGVSLLYHQLGTVSIVPIGSDFQKVCSFFWLLGKSQHLSMVPGVMNSRISKNPQPCFSAYMKDLGGTNFWDCHAVWKKQGGVHRQHSRADHTHGFAHR